MNKKVGIESARIIKETGIDFIKYQNQELGEKIDNLIGFYQLATVYLLKYTAIFLLITAGLIYSFHLQQKNLFGIVLFALFGIAFSVVEGVTLGLRNLVKKAVLDGAKVVEMMLDFLKEMKEDIQRKKEENPDTNISPSYLLEGLSYTVFIPAIGNLIRSKIKFFVKPVLFVIENSILFFTKALAAVLTKSEKEHTQKAQDHSETSENQDTDSDTFEHIIDDARKQVGPLGDSVSRMVAWPIKLIFNIALFLGMFIFVIIYFVFL
jgi:hypothetical protein